MKIYTLVDISIIPGNWASSFVILFIVNFFISTYDCFQQQTQQQVADALINLQKQIDSQQQQQQHQSIASNNNQQSPTTTLTNQQQKQHQQHQQPKSNHRLVSKIKDARHRRRHNRQNRHRHHYHKQLAKSNLNSNSNISNNNNNNAASGNNNDNHNNQVNDRLANPPSQSPANALIGLTAAAAAAAAVAEPAIQATAAASATALTALESIVEEVARAGGQSQQSSSPITPTPSNQQLPISIQQQQQQQPTSSSSSAVDVLLDGSGSGGSSPMSSLAPSSSPQTAVATATSSMVTSPSGTSLATVNQQQHHHQSQAPSTQTILAQGPTPTAHHITRGPLHSTRGFLLTSTLSKIYNLLNVTEFALEMRDGISSRASCVACNAVVGLFLSPLYSKEVFSAAIRTVCTSFKIQTARVCSGLAESFQDDFEFIRKNTKLTRDEVCGVVFGVDCARRQTYNLFWTVPIPEMPTTTNINKVPHNQIISDSSSASSSTSQNPTKTQQNQANQNQPINMIEQNNGGLPHSLTNMGEDAPDLFEYRRSNIVIASAASNPVAATAAIAPNNGQKKSSLASSHQLSEVVSSSKNGANGPQQLSKGDQQQQQKSAKMLSRPQYIFDDDQQFINTNNDDQQQQQQQQQQVSTNSGNNRDENNNNNKHLSSFVHLTDIHIDPYYEPGSLNDCGEPLCCRATSGLVAPNDKRRQAGRWGDYGNCDVPVRTLRNALERIREQHSDAEYWLWTGDISPHDIWNITKSESANHVRLVTKLVRQYSNGLPVFPVIGNHEAHPVNSFSPPEIKGKFSMSWLYDLLADEWSDWLPSDALRTLRIGGFYKLQVRKGFRIIALNTNYCARLNPWSFYDPVDPANQLKWLVDELLEAELNQDKVHIIGHVPPDNRECTQAWLFNFINIVDRFRSTIVAQFYGHTHRDEWRIIYSLAKNEEPIGVQYIGPSITPFTENNPAYRIYHQDKQGNILDSETYYFNLTEANETPRSEPNWRFSYSVRQHLNMTQGLNPASWHQYLQKLHDDDQLFETFHKNFYRYSDVKSGQVCKNKCRYQLLSDLRLLHPYKTKPKPFLANRKTSNHHRDRHDHHNHHHKRLRHSQE